MPFGYSPKLPLHRSDRDGYYALTKSHEEVVKQNLKMLLLTNPGERIMDPFFGVGLMHFLFEQDGAFVREEIAGRIREQVDFYMPFVEITDIRFGSAEDDPEIDPNSLFVYVQYEIIPLGIEDSVELLI